MIRSVSIVGCGTIGKEIATHIADGTAPVNLSVVYDHHPDRVTTVCDQFKHGEHPRKADTVAEVFETDLVIEAADKDVVDDVAVGALESGSSCMLMSVGALADTGLRSNIFRAAERSTGNLYLPSGSIAGLDSIKTAALTGELENVSLQTTKPLGVLKGAPYIEESGIDLNAITEPTVVFEGTADEAAPLFPSNINVAMTLSLAGVGPEETTVRIVADPTGKNNVHEITAEGGMGRIETSVRNVPSPNDQKTNYLAAISAIEKLRGLNATIDVGT